MIVIVSCQHFPDDERIYHRQIKTLLKQDISIRYFTRSESTLDLSEPGLRHFNLSLKLSIKSYSKQILRQLQVSKAPLFFHIHEPELLPLAKSVKQKLRSTIIYDVHENLDAMYRTFSQRSRLIKEASIYLKNFNEKRYLKFVDHIVLANRPLKKTVYESKGFQPLVLENFPEKKYVSGIKNKIELGHTIIYHGHLGPERGIHDLIAAMPTVLIKMPDARLTLLGTFRTKEFQNQVNRLVCELHLEKIVQIKSQIPHIEVWGELNQHAVGVIPFQDNLMWRNNTPTKLFEMMAAGCRIVVSDLPPIRNFVSDTVHWITPGDIPSLAAGIIDSFLSINQTDWIKKNRILVKEKYNWESIINKFIALYNPQ